MVPPLSNRQIWLFPRFYFLLFFFKYFVRTLHSVSPGEHPKCLVLHPTRPCYSYTLKENTNKQQPPCCCCFSLLILSVSAMGGMARVPGGAVRCSPDHPAHLQCNSYSASLPLPMVFHWFSLVALIILFLCKAQHKESVSFFLLFTHFLQISGRPRQEQKKEMMNENRHQFLAIA